MPAAGYGCLKKTARAVFKIISRVAWPFVPDPFLAPIFPRAFLSWGPPP